MEEINTIDNSLVNGFMKLWLYQFYLLARTSWPFLIYDFERSFAVDIKKKTTQNWRNGLELIWELILDSLQSYIIMNACNLSNASSCKTQLILLWKNYILSELTKVQNSPKFGKRQIYPEWLMRRLSWILSFLHKIAIKALDLEVLIQIQQNLKREN